MHTQDDDDDSKVTPDLMAALEDSLSKAKAARDDLDGRRVAPLPANKQALLEAMGPPEVIVTVRMPAELRDRLAAIAARQERSIAACIRYFLISDVRAWERSHAYREKQRNQPKKGK